MVRFAWGPFGSDGFFIDSGIDTGERIVLREVIPPGGRTDVRGLKGMLFDCDARLYRRALEALMEPGFRFKRNDILKGRRYYVMSKMLTRVVSDILRDNAGAPGELPGRDARKAGKNAPQGIELDSVALKE